MTVGDGELAFRLMASWDELVVGRFKVDDNTSPLGPPAPIQRKV